MAGSHRLRINEMMVGIMTYGRRPVNLPAACLPPDSPPIIIYSAMPASAASTASTSAGVL